VVHRDRRLLRQLARAGARDAESVPFTRTPRRRDVLRLEVAVGTIRDGVRSAARRDLPHVLDSDVQRRGMTGEDSYLRDVTSRDSIAM